ncbi:hypothetical protein P170DRAFT_449706 [Aspergillus steynii IBT 23096]|uniref:Enoyl reductase (ER) domain-containing protein n=1 Tax=Aspergillus steynii IBT 23096 TaxID=1392250 RepID=A0A2I2G006_9EURO|nr:uncharacterized protein P170DRAFT_449706 [Aspergillus steynii IBT 23096]PLB46203.1 hypothetical protein P170DRAFT_449706 [Aspergillus steynii IBT 23096]
MTTTQDNISLHVDENLEFSVQHGLELPDPEQGEFLVETHFSGVNPSDTKHATDFQIHPVVLGYDYCGKVLKTPTNSRFQPGQIVAGYARTRLGRPLKYGVHQIYLISVAETAFALAIFRHSMPPGASTSVGISALQLARASRVKSIFVTASPERHALLRELGSTHCFDYKSLGYDSGLVVVQPDPRFKLPLAAPNHDVSIQIAGIPRPFTIPARYADYERAWKGVQWVAENYGDRFRLPSVEVFEGTADEALEELKVVGNHGRGFGKLVLKHPF